MIFNGKMPIGTKSMTNKVLLTPPLASTSASAFSGNVGRALRGIAWEDRVTPHPHPSNKINIG